MPEPLEGRITPTGNLAIGAISVVDSNEKPITTVDAGQWVYIRADFTALNLPSNASYRVGFTVNGLTVDSGYVTWGAGASGTQGLNIYWGTFNATPGANQVTVTLDPDHSVAETSYADNAMNLTFNAAPSSSGSVSYTVAQIRAAYGVNNIPNFGATPAVGTGQTIALDEAGNEPTIVTDLDGFDQAMGLTTGSIQTLYQQFGAAASFVTVYNQQGQDITANIATSGSNGVPAKDPTGHWEGEETLDVEWAHALAPGAKIDIIEVPDDSNWPTNLLAGDKLAASLPGVSAISNSWGLTEWSGETAYDSSTFVTPSGHSGVTFLTASNDNGANVYPSPPNSPPPSVGNDGYYPATSPNVVSVGGTELTLSNDGYGGETGWSFPAPTSTVVDGSASYTQAGTWASQSGGFGGKYGTASGGSSSSASWTVPITPADTGWGTEVSATWTAGTGDATNATYTVYDGGQASGTILGTVTADQTKAPIGTVDGSSRFQELGVFFPTLNASGDGTLTVVLNAKSANGKVVADTIGAADGWASTGGPTRFESEPSYQQAFQNTGHRVSPDVSFDASQNSGVDLYQNGGLSYGASGTSLSSPCWAGLIAVVNQGRVADGGTPLNSTANPTQTLQALYKLPAGDYRDITTGYNGFYDGPGYDDVTGLGTPIVNLLVPDLVAYGLRDQLLVSTQPPASVTAGSGFGLVVTAENSSGIADTAYHGDVTIALANNPGGGGLGGTLTATAVNGVATFSGLTLDVADAGYLIQATATGLTAATSSPFSVVAAAAYAEVYSVQPPSTVTAGAGFGLAVTIVDAYGNVATTYSVPLTVFLANNPGGSVLGGTLTEAPVGGVATFSGLTLNKAAAGYILGVPAAGLAGRSTPPIAVIPATATQLVITQQPVASVVAGIGFGLQVAIEDPFGNLETGDSGTSVTASLKLGAGPLLGTIIATDSGGLATFANLADDKAEAIALDLGAGTLIHATSNHVLITPAAATKLVIQAQPSATASVGQPFAVQPVIVEEDQFGNPETGDATTVVTASLASGAGPLQGATTAVVSGGVARFANLADKKVETLSLKFTGGSLVGATSNPIVVNKATTTVTWSAPPATYRKSVTLTATVSVASGGTTPTGSVTFLDGSTVLGTSNLDGTGHATFSTANLPLGTRSITVKYSGDSNDAPGASPAASLFVRDPAAGDFDGDGKSDIAIYDQTAAVFYITDSSTGVTIARQFGNPTHVNIPVMGDFDGDGKTDIAIYDQTASVFYIAESGGGATIVLPYGNSGHLNVPVAVDFDGDGKTDVAIYDQTAAEFYIQESAGGSVADPYGNPSHKNIPVAGDFDGDGKTDAAIYDQTAAVLYVAKSGGGNVVDPFGNPSHVNVPVAGDFDGDGKTDVAIYDQTAAVLYVRESGGGSITDQFGNPADVNLPIAGDFNGDGKADVAIYDQAAGVFYVADSAGGKLTLPFGNKKHANIPV